MAIQPREEWTRQFLANLDSFQAGRRNGASSQRRDDQAEDETRPESREGASVPIAPSCPDGHVKVYPDLGAAALRQRSDLPYRLWLLLRQEQPDGRGRVTEEHIFGLSVGTRRETRRWLKAGMGTFWHWDKGGSLYLHGLKSVSGALGTLPEKHGAYVPMADVENLARFRAAIYAAWFIKPATISQAKLGAIFGRTPKTLQRWAKLADLEVGHNLAWTDLPDEVDLQEKAAEVRAAYYWTERWDGRPGQRRTRGDKPDEMTTLVWPLPNTYRASYQRAPKTRLQRSACQALSKLSTTSRASGQRVYCHRGPGQARQAARLIEAGGIAFMEEARAHHGYGLWGYCA